MFLGPQRLMLAVEGGRCATIHTRLYHSMDMAQLALRPPALGVVSPCDTKVCYFGGRAAGTAGGHPRLWHPLTPLDVQRRSHASERAVRPSCAPHENNRTGWQGTGVAVVGGVLRSWFCVSLPSCCAGHLCPPRSALYNCGLARVVCLDVSLRPMQPSTQTHMPHSLCHRFAYTWPAPFHWHYARHRLQILPKDSSSSHAHCPPTATKLLGVSASV